MERASCCNGEVKKGSWTVEEDRKLIAYIEKHGEGGWRSMPTRAGLQRCGKSCRLRWKNYLRPGIKRGTFTLEEEETIIRLHAELGNRWSAIAKHLPQRTDNEIKNYWNAQLKKRLINVGVDPTAHQPMQGSMPDAGRSSLINKLATQLPRSHSVETIKAIIMPSHQCSPSPTADDDDDMATMFQALSSFSEASPSCSIEAPMWDCMDGGASLGLDVDENVSQVEYEDLDFDMFDHVF